METKSEVKEFIELVVNSSGISEDIKEKGLKLLDKDHSIKVSNKMILEDIIAHFVEHYGFDPTTRTETRKMEVAQVRQLCMYVVRENTTYSLPKMGKIFKKHHSTVHHSLLQTRNAIEYDKVFRNLHEKMLAYKFKLTVSVKPELWERSL